MPDEVRRLPKNQAILLIRGEKPIKLYKVSPEEHPDYAKLRFVKATEHIPEWRLKEQELCPTVAQSESEPSTVTPDSPVDIPAPIEKLKKTNLKAVPKNEV